MDGSNWEFHSSSQIQTSLVIYSFSSSITICKCYWTWDKTCNNSNSTSCDKETTSCDSKEREERKEDPVKRRKMEEETAYYLKLNTANLQKMKDHLEAVKLKLKELKEKKKQKEKMKKKFWGLFMFYTIESIYSFCLLSCQQMTLRRMTMTNTQEYTHSRGTNESFILSLIWVICKYYWL